ncbi:MAG: hypothetical protein KA257_14640 [Opitutaceae bacterium]|nr:hypothetical protein [Opitutaceae bacterium]MBP9914169.1 hypothetical protein [Opitutaceae bacterium]
MKLLFLWLALLLPALCFGEDVLRKAAVLILPEQFESGSGNGYFMSGMAAPCFRMPGITTPLQLLTVRGLVKPMWFLRPTSVGLK